MSLEDHSLPIPTEVTLDPNAKELLRAWVAYDSLHCSMRVSQWEPHAWGIVLCDIVRYVVEAEVEEKGADPKQTVRIIMDKFVDELNRYGEGLGFEEKIE